MNLEKFDTFLFDLDDTLWRVSKLLPGAKELLKKLRARNKTIYFVTNNNLFTRKDTARRLTKLGIPAKEEEVINTGYVASEYFKRKKATVLPFGEGLERELKINGIKIKKKLPVDYVVIGDDLEFNFDKMALAMQAIQRGAKFISCNMGKSWYIGEKWSPGNGALAMSVIYATGVEPILLGKPHKPMLDVVRKFVKNPSKTVMVGNDVADVQFAKRLKCKSVLLSTKSPKNVKPDLRVKSLRELHISVTCELIVGGRYRNI